jgi:UDP-2,3-diacylglucosamine pyrophosphatase LpxH
MTPPLEHNLLVVSDLHLGEDLRPGGTAVSYLRHIARLEAELDEFLRHHITHRLDDRPWRLVVNGDMVDFMSMKILPDARAEQAAPDAADPNELVDPQDEDRLYGLGFSERAAQKKMERVIVRHQRVFRALGDFVRAGNELVIVVGNHDVEFHYTAVQRTLVEWLCGLSTAATDDGAAPGVGGIGASAEERALFAARVQFCPWFYYQPDRIYIEHGHQFDEYCSFDYQLHPAPPVTGETALPESTASRRRGKSRFALSMAHAGMRYFANQIPEYDPHTAEHWGFVNYVKWVSGLGWNGLARISYLYGLLVWKVVEAWYAMRNADADRKKVHLDRLRALSRTWRIAEDKLHALAALHRVPVTRRFFGVLRALFLDRVLLSGLAFGVALGLVTGLSGAPRLWAPISVLGGALLLNELLGRMRLESSAHKLRAVPRRVHALLGAPLIVFGHSHEPERVPLPNGAVYFNTGTWASEDARLAFTHLVVTGEGGEQRAELRQWRDGTSAPFVLPR